MTSVNQAFDLRSLPRGVEAFGDDAWGIWCEMVLRTGGQPTVAQRFRWLDAGEFWMGSPDGVGASDEHPRHLVRLTRGFWLGETACTQSLWRAVMGTDPSHFKGDELPVEQVSWEDAQNFLGRLEELLPGCGASLPTEAEWEYACRAGTETAYSYGDAADASRMNVGERVGKTVAVRSHAPNGWGLYEMHGNVWEWCADWKRTYGSGQHEDPRGPEGKGASRAIRGGSWFYRAAFARSASRLAFPPGYRSVILGFRVCLRSVQPGLRPAERAPANRRRRNA